ncbi:hypothetical protein GALL_357790 [mine drainage metagenome]|uniref:Uncharacterized protein n=1 Tax=mine drainage metagenome TaxID=410659 RepID=A0A1J5R2P2_9ZZZZ
MRPLPLLIDALDDDPRRHARLSWRQAITHQIGQTCAAYFDAGQADWKPARASGLYRFWFDTLQHDHGIGVLMGLPRLHRALAALPPSPELAEAWALQRLGLPQEAWGDYLEAVLLSVQGWASWCAYLAWQARLNASADNHLRELLAVRLAWGVLLLECKDEDAARPAFAAVRAAWRAAASARQRAEQALLPDEVWQLALEIGYQRDLLQRLRAPRQPAPEAPEVQAAFCIDVRSEPLRRALEAQSPALRTLGVAGFFGLPAAYTPLGTSATQPQLPGLLAPALSIAECVTAPGSQQPSEAMRDAALRARTRAFAWSGRAADASRWPAAAFSFVESAGFAYLGALARWVRPAARARASDDHDGLPQRLRPLCRPALLDLPLDAKAALAARVLRTMGLQRGAAPLVLLVAHASQSRNNAHAAALDCGACCGHSCEVNARALARLLNEPLVRAALGAHGIELPAETVFLAALHNTTTDEVEAHDVDLLPPHAVSRWQGLQAALGHACDQVRRERAGRLGLDASLPPRSLLAQLRRRANDGAETRPEWGLAGNAALLIAPRSRTLGVDLGGRCFLHDYDAAHDPDGSLLEGLMTAPLVVAHWINWQYHASTCAPQRLGSGNKLLHNVVGGNLGVFEGNGGDLRIGLSRQSLHDGTRWVHEPLRLSVLIDAPQPSIERVLQSHPQLSQLVDHGWIHLLRFDASGAVLRRDPAAQWTPC